MPPFLTVNTNSRSQPERRLHAWPLAASLLLLNISLSFRNIWPTPAIKWGGELSIELAIAIVLLAVLRHWLGPLSRRTLRALSWLWVVLVISHYADVTAPALYGREVNLYWDSRNLTAVAAMLGQAAPIWLVVLVIAVSALILGLLYYISRLALGRLVAALDEPLIRTNLGVAASLVVALCATEGYQPKIVNAPTLLRFPSPVTETYAHQAQLVWKAQISARSNALPASPAMSSDLSRLGGADVLLLFIESYGAVSFDRPEFASRLAAARADFDAAINDTGRDIVSAYVESPTFGGNSWLAHITLLSGVEVRDRDTNALLMTQNRETLVTAFSRRGYRTVAVMPGLWQSWPEGVFYKFDEIYNGSRLDYWGPQFGWWDIPDQFAIAQMDALEVGRRSRPPLFVFLPTISTHIPFSPVPPYQSDWKRVLTRDPYDRADVDRVLDEQPDWLHLGPGYAKSLEYAYRTLAGYLRMRTDRDFVLILLGDHQPPAAVTGEGASWDVPVHVIANRGSLSAVLAQLRTHGFQPGLEPKRPDLGHMQALLPMLLDAFGHVDHAPLAAQTQ